MVHALQIRVGATAVPPGTPFKGRRRDSRNDRADRHRS